MADRALADCPRCGADRRRTESFDGGGVVCGDCGFSWGEATMVSAPRQLMSLARRTGGQIDGTTTRYDHERGGRVLELRVFWPDQTGYAPTDNGAADQTPESPKSDQEGR